MEEKTETRGLHPRQRIMQVLTNVYMDLFNERKKQFESLGDGRRAQSQIGRNYSSILLVFGDSDLVLDVSEGLSLGREVQARMGLKEEQNTMSIYRKDVKDYLENLMRKREDLEEGKKEVDGALVADDKGRILLNQGTILLPIDREKIRRYRTKGRIPTGAATNALLSISTEEGVWSYKVSFNDIGSPVQEYNDAYTERKLVVIPRQTQPDRMEMVHFKGTEETDKIPIQEYDWSSSPPQ